jgi:glycosyltransferase involved in cell wall biosynthesis
VATFHLSNGVDTKSFGLGHGTVETRRKLTGGHEVLVLYAGLHGLAQGLDQILAAAGAMANDKGLQFALVGDGPEKAALRAEARRVGLGNLSFLDPVPFAEIPNLLGSADIIIVTLKTEIPGAVPSKLYEAMASGKAVVLVASGEAAAVVQEYDTGIVVAPGDLEGLVRAIRCLRDNPSLRQELGERGRRAAEAHFDRERVCVRFINFLQNSLFATQAGVPCAT